MKYFIIALLLVFCSKAHGDSFKLDGVTVEYETYHEKETIMCYKLILENTYLVQYNIPGIEKNKPYTYWDLLKCATIIRWADKNIYALATTKCDDWNKDTQNWDSVIVVFNKRLLKENAMYYSCARVAAHEGIHAFIGKYAPHYRGDEEQFAIYYTELFQRSLCEYLGVDYKYTEKDWYKMLQYLWE